MKPLALAVLSVLVSLPGVLQAQVTKDASDSLKELKKKYAAGGQKPDAPPAAEAPPKPEDPGLRNGSVLTGRPMLYARYAKGPNGYSLKELTENMNWTEKNLSGLVDYIHPWKKGEVAPVGQENEEAHKSLASESAAATELIAEADAALAKGIPRDPKDPRDPRPRRFIGYVSRASYAHRTPTPAQRLEAVAGAQTNVLGHAAALIAYKRLNPPDAEGEANTERWLEGARKSLAAAEKSARE
ncbi:MAG: hypothetical protein HYV14_03735 [Elusimicrobia bacterium]|nr:hypothetical protein [Elusimicrobiota bacterium]